MPRAFSAEEFSRGALMFPQERPRQDRPGHLIGAAASVILYYVLNKDANIITEYSKVNWAPFVLGIVIVGLEVGYIYAYKAGWPVSTAQIVQAAILAVILIFVGYFLYRENITWNKIGGILVCLVGLGMINIK